MMIYMLYIQACSREILYMAYVCVHLCLYIYICRCSVDVKYEYDGWAPVEVRHL